MVHSCRLPGVAEMEIVERKAEPVLVFMADKTSAGAWNLAVKDNGERMTADGERTTVDG